MNAHLASGSPPPLSVIAALQEMAFAGMSAQDFAGRGDLKPFGHGLPGLIAFGTSHTDFLSARWGDGLV
jgi:hypothetical protein